MTVLITLTLAGSDSGPFNLYSNLDGFTTPFETGVSKASLESGYSSISVPDYTTTIRVVSTGDCVNFVNIVLENTTTTTTSTSSTTTTTTTLTPLCLNYTLSTISQFKQNVSYLDCITGERESISLGGGGVLSLINICALQASVIVSTEVLLEEAGECTPTTTTTTTLL